MDEQNQGGQQPSGYPPQGPQPPYPQQPQAPTVTGQTGGGMQLSTASGGPQTGSVGPNRLRKALFVSILVLALMAAGAVLWSAFGNKKADGGDPVAAARGYDSPIGLLPAFERGTIRSGTYKLSAAHVTGGDFSREGRFLVDDRNQAHFEILPDADTVNELLSSLYGKDQARIKAEGAFSVAEHGATRYQRFDFNTLLGYGYLYDKQVSPGGFIPQIEAAKADEKTAARYPLLKLGESCDDALRQLKARTTGTSMSTRGLIFDRREVGDNKTRASVNLATMQDIDRKVVGLLENCYDLEKPAAAKLKAMAENLKENTTKGAAFIYWQRGDKHYLDIEVPSELAGRNNSLKFEFTDLSQAGLNLEGESASYLEKRNLFGLTYSVCRTTPVVTTAVGAGYRFLPEDIAYVYPRQADSGYYCTTLAVPPQFVAPAQMTLKHERDTLVRGTTQVNNYRAFHDLGYLIERYRMDKDRFPSLTEFNDLTGNNLGPLSSVAHGLVRSKTFVYQPEPAGCTNNCLGYEFTYQIGSDAAASRKEYSR